MDEAPRPRVLDYETQAAGPPWTRLKTAALVSIIEQLLIMVLYAPQLDGGVHEKNCALSSLGFWAAAAIIVVRRRRCLT